MANVVRCHLVNTDAINQHCGYGEGPTWEAAQADAIKKAKERDPNGGLNAATGRVEFSGGSGCL